MKFTLSWLKDHLDTSASVEEITETLTDLGLEVEGIHNPAARLADFTIGKVVKAEKHPDADRLRVCQVDVGADAALNIVCGAPNVHVDMRAPVATLGAELPGGFWHRQKCTRGRYRPAARQYRPSASVPMKSPTWAVRPRRSRSDGKSSRR